MMINSVDTRTEQEKQADSDNIFVKLVRNSFPLLESYHKDLLVHDKNYIDKYIGRSFIHITRQYGTHIDMLHEISDLPKNGETVKYLFGTADNQKIAQDIGSIVEYFARENERNSVLLVQYFNGDKLETINIDTALEISKKHREKVLMLLKNNVMNMLDMIEQQS